MAGDYKLIQVHADEEEDVVIHAGVVREVSGGIQELEPAEASVEAFEAPVDTSAKEPVEAAVEEKPEPVKPAVEKPETPKRVKKTAAQRKDTYRETTLEDLQSEKMPTVQKVVIIAAVLCIIGALAYYFLFMR